MRLTNNSGLSLSMAVWLARDTYDHTPPEKFPGQSVLSITSLLKSTRQIVLNSRLPKEARQEDVTDRISARLGQAVHDSIEEAWTHGYAPAMQALGYPQHVIDRVMINPDPDALKQADDPLPVYLEQRRYRQLDPHTVISGKFDQIIDGEIQDTKTTSVWAYLLGSKEEDYRFQGSAYRWLNPGLVTSDVMQIQHLFTDWQRSMVGTRKDYPEHRVKEATLELLPLPETENRIKAKVAEIRAAWELPEADLPECSRKELWMSEPQFKYYSNPATAENGGRATKNFPSYPAAAAHRDRQGRGVVITVPAKPKACGYCPVFDLCSQKEQYDHA